MIALPPRNSQVGVHAIGGLCLNKHCPSVPCDIHHTPLFPIRTRVTLPALRHCGIGIARLHKTLTRHAIADINHDHPASGSLGVAVTTNSFAGCDMRSRGVLEVLAGQASIVAILALALFLSIAATPILQQKKVVAHRIGSDVAIAKASAVTDAILQSAEGRGSLNTAARSFTATQLPNVLSAPASVQGDAFLARAIEGLRANPQQPQFDFVTVAGQHHLRYAVSDRATGVLLVDLPLDRERAAIGRLLGQSYLSSSAVGYLLVALLLFASFALRFYLRSITGLPEDERRALVEASLRDNDPSRRRNLLPWMLLLCALVFAFDLTNTMDSVVGIGYVLAVTLCLSSNRAWHITLVAAVGAVLLLLAPIVSEYDANWWTYLEHHSVTVFAIIVTGVFGSAHMRTSRAEALALAEATRSRHETEELRTALQRVETAEAEHRRIAEREAQAVHEIARQAGQLREAQERFQRAISGTQDVLFEIDVASRHCWVSPRFYDLIGYAAGELPETVASLYTLMHPEDRDAARLQSRTSISAATNRSISSTACCARTGAGSGFAAAPPRSAIRRVGRPCCQVRCTTSPKRAPHARRWCVPARKRKPRAAPRARSSRP